MANKVEGLFKKRYGYSPEDLQPKPEGQQLQKMLRKANQDLGCLQTQNVPCKRFEILESGTFAGEPYTLIQGECPDGSILQTLVTGMSVDSNELDIFATSIPNERWFGSSDGSY